MVMAELEQLTLARCDAHYRAHCNAYAACVTHLLRILMR
jgi:hypothetical protein